MDSSRKTWVQVLVMLSARCENEAPPSYAKRPLWEWAPPSYAKCPLWEWAPPIIPGSYHSNEHQV